MIQRIGKRQFSFLRRKVGKMKLDFAPLLYRKFKLGGARELAIDLLRDRGERLVMMQAYRSVYLECRAERRMWYRRW